MSASSTTATGRHGRGRPPGARNKRTREREAAMRAAAEAVAGAIPEAFDGDALALLQSIYLDPRQPMELRLDAARVAIRYERPALAAVAVEAHARRSVHDFSDAELAIIAGEAVEVNEAVEVLGGLLADAADAKAAAAAPDAEGEG